MTIYLKSTKILTFICAEGAMTPKYVYEIFILLTTPPKSFKRTVPRIFWWVKELGELPPVRASPRVFPSQRGSLALSPSLALVTATHRSSRWFKPWITQCEIILQLGNNSGHSGNPFSPLFYPYRLEFPEPFHLMWPRIDDQNILDPVCTGSVENHLDTGCSTFN